MSAMSVESGFAGIAVGRPFGLHQAFSVDLPLAELLPRWVRRQPGR